MMYIILLDSKIFKNDQSELFVLNKMFMSYNNIRLVFYHFNDTHYICVYVTILLVVRTHNVIYFIMHIVPL